MSPTLGASTSTLVRFMGRNVLRIAVRGIALGSIAITVALAWATSASAHGDGMEAEPAWVEPVVLLTSLWTVPFVIWLGLRFRRTWLRPPVPIRMESTTEQPHTDG